MMAIPAALAVGAVAFGVMSQQQQMKSQEKQFEAQADLAETRALQRDLARRKELERVSGAIKAARASSGSSIASPLTQTFLDEANTEIGAARLREFAMERQQAANFRSAAAATGRQRRLALIGGGLKMASSLFSAGMGAAGGLAGGGYSGGGSMMSPTLAGTPGIY